MEGSDAHSCIVPHPDLEIFVCKDGKESVHDFHEREGHLNNFNTTVNSPEGPPLCC